MQTAATGELEGGYREIVQVLQENPFGPTGKSLRWYRRISYGAEAWSALMLRHGRFYSLIKEDLNRYGLQVVKGDTLA